jgi:putative heme-binding domain-containing protein
MNDATPGDRRALLVETMSRSHLATFPKLWTEALSSALSSREVAVRHQAVHSAALLQIAQLDDALDRLAADKNEPADLRLAALRAIVLRRAKLGETSFALVLGQLQQQADPLARLAALEVVGRAHLDPAQLAQLLPAVSGDPLLDAGTLQPMLERSTTKKTLPEVAAYLAQALRGGWRPSEAELNRLLGKLPPEEPQLAKLRALHRETAKGHEQRLAHLEPLLKGGDFDRGRHVFQSGKVACAGCHRVGNHGGLIGPDLTRAGLIRTGRDLLESILVPSSTLAQGYETYQASVADGRVITGLLVRQSGDTLVLRQASGGDVRLRRDQVDDLRRVPTSLMPEGLERTLSRDELRDLLAYLQGLK